MHTLIWVLWVTWIPIISEGRRYDIEVSGMRNILGTFLFDTVDGALGEGGLAPRGEMWVDSEDSWKVENYTFVVYSDEPYSWPQTQAFVDSIENPFHSCRLVTYFRQLIIRGIDKGDPSSPLFVTYPLDGADWTYHGFTMMNHNPTSLGKYYSLTRPMRPNCTVSPCEGFASNPFKFPCHQRLAPRKWYFTVTNCNGTNDEAVTIHLHLINKGGWWQREFSLEEQGILELNIIAVPLFVILVFVFVAFAVWDRRQRGVTPAVVKWFLVILMLFLVEWVQKLFAYVSIANTGHGKANAYGAGLVARVMLMQLVCNFSTGFGVLGESFGGMSSVDCKLISGCGVVLLVLFIWMYILRSDDLTASEYQTPPAIAVGCLSFPIACYFCRNVWRQLVAHSEARGFFLGWGVLLLLHVSSFPVVLLVADNSSALDRFRKVEWAVHVADLFGCVMCGLLLRPRPWLWRVLRSEFAASDEEPNYILMMSAAELSDSPTTIPATMRASSDMLLTPMCSILSGSHVSGGVQEDNEDEVEL